MTQSQDLGRWDDISPLPEDRLLRVKALSDSDLLYAFDQVHNPAINDTVWKPLLEEEVRVRGLRVSN
jgi:hypothetical protein